MEDFEKMVAEMRANFTCLRCGECCFGFGVHNVPGYDEHGEWTGDLKQLGVKPEHHHCHHLEPAHVEDGIWQPAKCRLHDTPDYPWECGIFVFNGVCWLGRAVWQTFQEKNPEAKLPEEVAKFLTK